MKEKLRKEYSKKLNLELILVLVISIYLLAIFSDFVVAGVGENVTVSTEFTVGTSAPIINTINTQGGSIVLTPNATTVVNCSINITDFDTDVDIINVSAELFDNTVSFYGDSDDNNYHYTNTSCIINRSIGGINEAQADCLFDVWYYANSGVWNCSVNITDNSSLSTFGSNTTNVEPLLAIGVPDTISYGLVNATEVSLENVTNVTNLGNVRINLSLYGYSHSEGDNFSMNCSLGANISMENEKYNLSASNPGTLNLTEFEINYTSLTNNSVIRKFDLYYRQNDVENEAKNQTYWRIHVPKGVGGTCQGNIVFGATQGAES